MRSKNPASYTFPAILENDIRKFSNKAQAASPERPSLLNYLD